MILAAVGAVIFAYGSGVGLGYLRQITTSKISSTKNAVALCCRAPPQVAVAADDVTMRRIFAVGMFLLGLKTIHRP